jgi:hypothetical protein
VPGPVLSYASPLTSLGATMAQGDSVESSRVSVGENHMGRYLMSGLLLLALSALNAVAAENRRPKPTPGTHQNRNSLSSW